MDIKIGSLNCLHLSAKSDSEKVAQIARIIYEEHFDIVALQEVKNGGLDAILNKLNPGSDRTKGKWAGCADHNDYAFVWNTKHLTLPKTKLANGQMRIAYPRVYNQYKRDPELGRISFARPPFYGRFQTNWTGIPKVEIRLINAHIRFSKGKDGEEHAPTANDLELRRFEYQALTKSIYYRVSDKVYGKAEGESSPTTAYTILLGDYNMNLRESGAGSPFLGDLETVVIQCGRSRSDGKVIVTRQSELTTLKKQKDSDEENTEQDDEQRTEQKAQIFANNYDHFSYDTNRFSGTRKRISRVNTVEKYCNNDPQEHIKKVSDHTPIKMSLNIKKE